MLPEFLQPYLKPILAYAGTAAFSWAASRYHLSGDQVSAIAADLAMGASFCAGIVAHYQAGNKGGAK